MNLSGEKRWRSGLLGLGLAMALAGPASAANYILWDKEHQRVDADIHSWDTMQVLKRIAASTHWQIYLQPGTHQVLPTRFRHLKEGDALRRLLGDLSYVQVPRTNGPPRLYVFRTSRDEATELVKAHDAAGKGEPIPNELLVKLKPGEKIEDLARRLGAEVVGRIDGMDVYRLRFADAESARRALDSLGKDPSAASVEYNCSLPRPDSPEALAEVAPRLSLQPKLAPDGKYLVVGLIDSAVQARQGRVDGFLLDPISVAGQTQPPDDHPTHGTDMSEGILNGLAAVAGKDGATSVRILPVDVYGGNPTSSTFDVALGIYRAVNDGGARIINLSMGSGGDSSILHDVIASSHSQGVIFFAAAGNEPVATPTFPAAYPEVTAVTAVDRAGDIASYANYGSFVQAGGPSAILVTFGDLTYIVTGTSGATAFVSGVAAGMVETTGRTPAQIERLVPRMMPVNRP